MSAREDLARGFCPGPRITGYGYSPPIHDHSDCLATADTALAALKAAGWSMWRQMTPDEEAADQW